MMISMAVDIDTRSGAVADAVAVHIDHNITHLCWVYT